MLYKIPILLNSYQLDCEQETTSTISSMHNFSEQTHACFKGFVSSRNKIYICLQPFSIIGGFFCKK